MKYMGSKRTMLLNGLGDLLIAQAQDHDRIVDLFCGASNVAWFSAQRCGKQVFAVDLQMYATTLAGAVIRRTKPIEFSELETKWLTPAKALCEEHPYWREASQLDISDINTVLWSKRARALCTSSPTNGSIWSAYGGFYFSPTQAVSFDTLVQTVPKNEPHRTVCIAAAIIAASKCVAAPGHTAQPFRATSKAAPFLREAWQRDPFRYAEAALKLICPMHARLRGQCKVANAISVASRVQDGDLVFIDPPYSDVHYSRFYHVLETIARGKCGPVFGAGRYPPTNERPKSEFSQRSRSVNALSALLEQLTQADCTVVLTFPSGECSNGLSGEKIIDLASRWYEIKYKRLKSRFSTLGGNGRNRGARRDSTELILIMRRR